MQPNGTFNRVELYAGDRHLATYDDLTNMTYFIHDDWQGTERVRSSYAGGSYETCVNLPYGDQQTCTGATDPSPLHYTGKMRDMETTLDYFGARYYSSGMGHWMLPDWADKPTSVPYANFGDPQSLNLYAMVTGNPVSKQDSDGHKLMDAFTGWSDGGANPSSGGNVLGTDPVYSAAWLKANDEIAPGQNSKADFDNSGRTAQPKSSNQQKRESLAANAEAQKGSTAWAYDAKPCGNKCSKFVGDMLALIGIGIEQGYKSDPTAPPVAGDWLNPKANIANWQVLKAGQSPAPGDIAAEAISDPHVGATAHMGIVISNGRGGVTAVAAGHNSVYRTNEFFDPNHVVTFRRYTGN